MKATPSKHTVHDYRYGIPAAVVIVVLLVLRFVLLNIDPPYFFAGYTQAHLTDPYHLTFAARNAVLFDDWNPFDYHRWDVFKYSLVSGTAWLLFSLFGVSRITANLAGVFLSIGGMVFFVFGLAGYLKRRELMISALVLLLSSMLFFYGRLPFLETGLMFLSGLTFFIFMRYHESRWGQALSGFLVVLAALAGKLFGLILLAPILVMLIYEYRRQAVKPILMTIGGSLAGLIVYTLVFYGGDFSVMMNYYAEQTTGMYGAPKGLTSPLGFVVQFITFGSENGLLAFSPFMVALTVLGLGLLLFARLSVDAGDRRYFPVLFSALWIVFGVLGLMPFNYRPLRYTLFLFLPVSVMVTYVIGFIHEKKIRLEGRSLYTAVIPVFFLAWYAVANLAEVIWGGAEGAIDGVVAVFLTALVALLIAGLGYVLIGRKGIVIGRTGPAIIILVLVAGMVVRQGVLLYEGLARPGTYLQDLNREVSEMVGGDAVLTGPYTPALTIDNNLRGIIYVFGLAVREPDLFRRFPITHVVTDRSNFDLAKKDYGEFSSALNLRRLRLREGSVEVLRLPGATALMSDYERAAAAYGVKQFDSAMVFSERFSGRYPDNLCGRFGLATAYYTKGRIDEFLRSLEDIAADFPNDFRAHMFCKEFYELAYRASKDPKFGRLVNYHLKCAHEINPALP